MRKRALDALIDLCVLLDLRFSWRWVARLFLWAWDKQQKQGGVLLYDAWEQRWAGPLGKRCPPEDE